MFFIKKSFADEIAESMERSLVSPLIDKEMEFDTKVLKAVELLNEAADLLDEVGFADEAEIITSLLESLDEDEAEDEEADSLGEEIEEDHMHVDDNCAKCGDVSFADDEKEKALDMLEKFKSKSKDMDFEDELD